MGFFSWKCKSENCNCSILSGYATEDTNDWMRFAVVVAPSGEVFRGEYDGYGRLRPLGDDFSPTVDVDDRDDIYHEACWELAGSPTDNRGGSEHAPDQGYFIDDFVYNDEYLRPDPRLTTS